MYNVCDVRVSCFHIVFVNLDRFVLRDLFCRCFAMFHSEGRFCMCYPLGASVSALATRRRCVAGVVSMIGRGFVDGMVNVGVDSIVHTLASILLACDTIASPILSITTTTANRGQPLLCVRGLGCRYRWVLFFLSFADFSFALSLPVITFSLFVLHCTVQVNGLDFFIFFFYSLLSEPTRLTDRFYDGYK